MVPVGEGSVPEFGGWEAASDSLRDFGMVNLRPVMGKEFSQA